MMLVLMDTQIHGLEVETNIQSSQLDIGVLVAYPLLE